MAAATASANAGPKACLMALLATKDHETVRGTQAGMPVPLRTVAQAFLPVSATLTYVFSNPA